MKKHDRLASPCLEVINSKTVHIRAMASNGDSFTCDLCQCQSSLVPRI